MQPEIKFRLPKDIPLEEYPSPQAYLEEARRLTDQARKQGLVLRVMGPIALHFYFPDLVDLYRSLERLGERVFTDIDYAAYGKQRGKLVPFFESQDYVLEKRSAVLSGGDRLIFFSRRIPMVDVFFDRLNYNHPIDYRARLELHPYCVTLTDLLLQKLQIVQINDKDLKDLMFLLLAAEFGPDDVDRINVSYLAKLLSDDWGFYYTSVTNLDKVRQAVEGVKALTEGQRATVRERVHELLHLLEGAPKTGKWKGRAKVGTSKIWYNEVTDWG